MSKLMVLVGASVALAGAAVAQQDTRGFLQPEAKAMADQAMTLAGKDLTGDAASLCRPPQPRPADPPPAATVVRFAPLKVFDDLYYVGSTYVGATIVRTSAGLVLIDSLTNDKAAAEELVGGMKALGLDPAQIKYLILTHGHGDHYGGVPYLRAHYPGFKVVASEADWGFMSKPSLMPDGTPDPSPKAPRGPDDIGYSGTLDLTVGNKTFTLVLTPGHTVGTTSLIYPVTYQGKRHVIAQWGGGSPSDARFSLDTVKTFADRAKALGADIRWGSHPRSDWVALAPQLAATGAKRDGLIAGQDSVNRYFSIAQLCKQAVGIERAARAKGPA